MKNLKNENGFSLFLTLMLVLLFSILGASLMAMTFNGVTKNDSREDVVQSTDLASKGIDHMTTQITEELNAAVTSSGISATEYVNKLNSIVEKYKCSGGTSLKGKATAGSGTDYEVCITTAVDDPASTLTVNSSVKYLRKNVTFKSTGKSGNKDDVLYSTYNIGSTQYPEVLNYAVGAYKVNSQFKDPNDSSRFPNIPGEGNLFLHGGASIEGDLKVDGNLVVSNNGIRRTYSESNNIRYYTDYSQQSVLPQITAVNSESKGKLFLGGNMYLLNTFFNGTKWNSSFNYDDHISSGYLNSSQGYYSKVGNSYNGTVLKEESLFFNNQAPLRTSKIVEVEPINFTDKMNKVKITASSSNETEISSNYRFHNWGNRNDVFLFEKDCKNWSCSNFTKIYDGTYYGSGNNNFKKFGTLGTVVLSSIDLNIRDGAYIHKDLYIRNSSKSSPSKIKGTVYVKGDLTIENAYLESDVIFYVDGDVTIRESEIYGIPYSDRKGSLIIFAKGNINLANNSVDKSNPSTFKGYFYSEQAMEIYGVGSNIKIEGGISARRITLNALRGDGRRYYTSSEQQNMSKDKSRLTIIYDHDIIKNFSELEIDTEPWISNISPPVELDRSYKAP